MSGRSFRLIVVGSGSAGLFVALRARHLGPVLVLTKSAIDDCNTRWAQGGIAAALGEHDSPAQHLADTIAAGAGLVDEAAARVLCEEAPQRIQDLLAYGVDFDRRDGAIALGREAAHREHRIVHAGGDRTGAAIEGALAAAVEREQVTVLDHHLVTRFVLAGGRVSGVEAVDVHANSTEAFEAPAVVLATGGAGQLYSHTTNPAVATGDGIALAFAAGAEVADLEFYQFHPTALRLPAADPFLISEAVRGEGAVLRNGHGEAFMRRYHELGDLAPRDVVARAIVAEMRRDGSDHVVLDATGIRGVDLAQRFPGVFGRCLEHGLDMREQMIPVAPAAHYLMGGVRTDVWGRTTLPGLYACGECACTGVHGANRLASNSLMETVVFGRRVAEAVAGDQGGAATPSTDAVMTRIDPHPVDRYLLRRLMWHAAGIERDGDEMRTALETLERAPALAMDDPRERMEAGAASTLARLMLGAALRREESRGSHARRDFPTADDLRWRRHQVFRREE